jgi:hypothetical protein
MENKSLWLCYFHNAKNKMEYWFYDMWSVWKQQLCKVEICQEDELFSDVEDTAYNLLFSSVTNRTCTNAHILVHEE